MVEFAGYSMPLHYKGGINQEHLAVRHDVGLFDVSHMGELRVLGEQATDFLSFATLNDPNKLRLGRGQYSMLPNDHGGIIDDIFVYREKEHEYLVVTNAANTSAAYDHLKTLARSYDVHVVDESASWALVALQGPGAPLLLGGLLKDDSSGVRRNATLDSEISGMPVKVSRTGYTGEDGFELYVDAARAVPLWRTLLEAGADHGLVPAGLGARDSLRLEVGYALYGNDLDEEHTTLESGLGWVTKLDKGDFVGRAALAGQKEAGVPRRLVGLRLTEKGFPRPGYHVLSHGEVVGRVTSGTVSPTLGYGIALAYVPLELTQEGTRLQIDARGRAVACVVQRPPFYTEGSIRR